jgi:hypothetical protein
MKKKRIILHIGTHKTGTTTLQDALYLNREKLLEQGYCYPSFSLDGVVRRKQQNLWALLGKDGQSFSDYWLGVIAEWEKSSVDVMIMSAEGLNVLVSRNHKAEERLREISNVFDIEVICYLRRPDTFFESFWNQNCKIGATKFHIGKFANQKNIVEHLEYSKVLNKWRSFSHVNAIGFESACADGLMESFSKLTEIELDPESKKRNTSPSMTCAAVLAALSRSTDKLYNWEKIEQHLGEDKRWTALGRVRRLRLLERFSDQRDELQRSYGVVFPDTMPDEPDDMIERPTAHDVEHLARPELLA